MAYEQSQGTSDRVSRMAYEDHFKLTDDFLNHLGSVIGANPDPWITSRYVGFLAVSATTVYELAIKDIFIEFCEKKNGVFGHFAASHFSRLNGRIKTDDLRGQHVKSFGAKYVNRFKRKEEELEKQFFRSQGVSVRSSYDNIIQWRHQFAHGGLIPQTPSYEEVVESYKLGKEIVHCLAQTMVR